MKFLPNRRPSSQSGQALLMILLAMSVVVTVALSVVSRSVTDIGTTTRHEDSTRAFVAAETGVERALVIGNTTCTAGATGCPDAGYIASVAQVGAGSQDINYPLEVASGQSVPLWFVSHDSAGAIVCNGTNPCFTGNRMKVCWGQLGTPANAATTPAVEVSIFYTTTPGNYANTRLAKVGYDPNASGHGSGFSAPDSGTCTIGTKSYQFQKTVLLCGPGPTSLNIPTCNSQHGLLFAKLRLLYGNTDHEVGVTTNIPFFSGSTFPTQGLDVTSTGTAGEANRKLRVFQGFSEPPPIFDSLIFSQVGVTK